MRESDKDQFPQAWKIYQSDHDELSEGTPITALPLVGPSMALELKGLGIRTVEDAANINDGDAMNIQGGVTLKNQANAYLAASEVRPEEKKTEVDDSPVDESIKNDPDVVPAPRRRGRPRKTA